MKDLGCGFLEFWGLGFWDLGLRVRIWRLSQSFVSNLLNLFGSYLDATQKAYEEPVWLLQVQGGFQLCLL